MQRFRCITTKTRLLSSSSSQSSSYPSSFLVTTATDNKSIFFCYLSISHYSSSTAAHHSYSSSAQSVSSSSELQAEDVVLSFKEWFESRNNPLIEKVSYILQDGGGDDDAAVDSALSQLGLRLSESFVLEVLNYRGKGNTKGKKGGGNNVLPCLKFFDWAGRQPGFYHTRATFAAIFKILSREKLMSLMLDFLDNYKRNSNNVHAAQNKAGFFNILVMGYAVAGKPELALQLFGKMRFQGLDLDGFAYHVLLNALVEHSYFQAVDVIAQQISSRGYENEATHSILIKNLCKQNLLDEAESYLREAVVSGWDPKGYCIGSLLDALCKKNSFDKAAKLLVEFRQMGGGRMYVENAYGMWIQGLVRAGNLDGAVGFFKSLEGYVPDVFHCNILIYKLLSENRLQEVCDLVMEMKESSISPDEVTMNAVLCFFCKAGLVEVALELYDLRAEFGLSPSGMAYNYLINTLCGDGSVDEAYRVLKNSMDQGYFPGKNTFSILADALCREGKFEKMKELVVVALERNFMPSDATYNKFISALCRAQKVEDGYLIHGELARLNKRSSRRTYFNLIHGFKKSNRGDIAARLIVEMQERGHSISRKLYRAVICCLCEMEDPEKHFFKLLEMQLTHYEPSTELYNHFIDGAGHAKKPELARQVFEMMVTSDIRPNQSSEILMLQSYLKSAKISDALNYFNDLSSTRKKIGRKLYNAMIVGLCKAQKPDLALHILGEVREKNVVPGIQCYEELVKILCEDKKYHMVMNLLDDLARAGRNVSSFLCNVLLLHSLKGQGLYRAWVGSRDTLTETPSSGILDQLIGSFSTWRFTEDLLGLEELVEQIFAPSIFTYNVFLRRLSMNDMDLACELFSRLCQKGYEPNRWTYDILVHGFLKHGRKGEARKWMNEMFRRGFDPTDGTKLLL